MKLTCEVCGEPGIYGYLKPSQDMVVVVCGAHRESYHEPIELADGTVAVAAVVAWLRGRAKRAVGEDREIARALRAAAAAIRRRDWGTG